MQALLLHVCTLGVSRDGLWSDVCLGFPFHVHTLPPGYEPRIVCEETFSEGAQVWTQDDPGVPVKEWNTEMVQMWLHEQGFDQYRTHFEEHEIDGETLQMLSEENLREMGVHIMGDRLKLLKAIAHIAPTSVPVLASASDSIESHRLASQFRRSERLRNSPLRTST